MVATALRSFEEWDSHPQGKALARTHPVSLVKVGDAPKRIPDARHRRPLEGVRVLELTRVLAGPVCGRTLAGKISTRASRRAQAHLFVAHGADVLWITSPKLPDLPNLDIDTSRGKRTTQLDLTEAEGRATLAELVKGTDVFLQAYRPGGLAAKGFGVSDVVSARPGVVYASLCAYGWEGPWKDRRGVCLLRVTSRRQSLTISSSTLLSRQPLDLMQPKQQHTPATMESQSQVFYHPRLCPYKL